MLTDVFLATVRWTSVRGRGGALGSEMARSVAKHVNSARHGSKRANQAPTPAGPRTAHSASGSAR